MPRRKPKKTQARKRFIPKVDSRRARKPKKAMGHWKRHPFGPHGKGWVWKRGNYTVMSLSDRKRRLRWFASRGWMQLVDRQGHVRFFASAEAAKRAADKDEVNRGKRAA